MKANLLGFVLTVFLIIFACKKEKDCQNAAIVQTTPCSSWGIEVNGVAYPVKNLPITYRKIGLNMCVEYVLFEDKALCPCCGGTWAEIRSIKMGG